MQDREVVAAIVAGDPEGLAAAYDQFAAPLFTYCRRMLADPDAAAGAVLDTFVIATSRLAGLRDPDRLRSWLHAVARNECLRRLRAAGDMSQPPRISLPADSDGTLAALELPDELRGQVLKACTDNTPAGRADRASVAHRAGSFGPAGFPKAIGVPGPLWWRRIRRHPRAAAAVTAVAAVAAVGGIVVILTAGSPYRAHVSTLALGGGIPAGAAGTASSSAGVSPAASHRTSPASARPTPSVTAPAGVTSPDPPTGRGSPPPSASPSGSSSSGSPSASSSPSPPPPPSASPSSSPSRSPGPGVLEATPGRLTLTATAGKAVSGTFILSAVGGPVSNYTISVPAGVAGKVKVSPAQGSIPGGGWVSVTVTVTSKVAVDTQLTVDPGRVAVIVVLSIKA
jgi:hypothetical protein